MQRTPTPVSFFFGNTVALFHCRLVCIAVCRRIILTEKTVGGLVTYEHRQRSKVAKNCCHFRFHEEELGEHKEIGLCRVKPFAPHAHWRTNLLYTRAKKSILSGAGVGDIGLSTRKVKRRFLPLVALSFRRKSKSAPNTRCFVRYVAHILLSFCFWVFNP